ncbi:hypothetical protein Y032_0017g3269 [Ancylostoma ceylanicum]|uniref:Uncharacterized protein n=1 Tax=Ancylostoma ceylanicum TaxID=53326 RepID=A0A016V6D2_9BILA|nr:hypothetical protein Y032_0017g3269 [Ancylostoma ceylanicum]
MQSDTVVAADVAYGKVRARCEMTLIIVERTSFYTPGPSRCLIRKGRGLPGTSYLLSGNPVKLPEDTIYGVCLAIHFTGLRVWRYI